MSACGSDKDGKGGDATRKLPQKHVDVPRKAYFAVFGP
jgi:hypothetical protein